jgi:cytochrome c oxidase subunit 3/cytochrome o ubiquinol oxidase subunit 3
MSHSPTTHDDMFPSGRALGLDHLKLGVWLFLGSEVMFFGGLIAAFLSYKVNNPSPEAGLLDVGLVGVNTFMLLASSLTVVSALARVERGDTAGMNLFLLVTIALGVAFLSGQAYEFVSLYREGVTLSSSVFGSSFFTLTGFHGVHVLVGVLWALSTFLRGMRGSYSRADHAGVEVFGLYWHFVDVVWIVLFTVIYLI